MKLQARTLEPDMRGADVTQLQDGLKRLGFSIDDREGFFGTDTLEAVLRFQRQHGIAPASGRVDENTVARINQMLALAEGPQPNVVAGRVLNNRGEGLAGRHVRLTAVDLDGERLIGRGDTAANGAYRITYPSEESLDLQVMVFANRRSRRPLAQSPLILNAEPAETINIAVGDGAFRGSPKFKRIATSLSDVDFSGSPTRLTDQNRIQLAQKTGVADVELARYIGAHRIAEETGLDAAVVFALVPDDDVSGFASLLHAGKALQRTRIKQAIENNDIPQTSPEELEKILQQLRDLAVDEMLAGRANTGAGDVSALLATTNLTERQKRAFLQQHLDNEDPTPDFWQSLRQQRNFNRRAIDELQLTLQLGALTLNHAPAVAAIKTSRNISDARELAGLDERDWLRLLADVAPPPEFRGRNARQEYARAIVALAAKSFPTARLLNQWSRDSDLGTDALRTFTERNPDFEFQRTTLRRYLADNPAALRGIADRDEFVGQMEALRRLISMVPDDEKFAPIRTLWQANLRSAHAIVGTGHAAFVRRFEDTIGAEGAAKIFALARRKTALSLAVLAKYAPVFNGLNPQIMGKIAIDEPPDAIPDWQTLFGSLDYCECRHCRSILSPAAYFVDLLQFLQRADAGVQNALEALLTLRPDLAQIRLDCDNTNTALPYIDLVNELLENAVVNGLSHLAASPGLQTTAATEELRANPQHINVAAYNTLAGETFPWSLPFNLWHEERAIYLAHLGISVAELMDVFHREGEAPAPEDRAAAYLGMTQAEREIIVGAAGSHNLGSSNAVLTLMRRSQTSFEALEELLTSRFINPAGRQIDFADDSCALEEATLDLTDAERGRLHRFRRLQKICGLSVFELDLILEMLPFSNITNDFLIQLADLMRLKIRFKVAVPEIISWWAATIPTRPGPRGTSLYTELFVNPAINNPLNPIEDIFDLDDAAAELRTVRPFFDSDGNLDAAISPLVVGALNITEEALRLLIQETLPAAVLNLRNLSHLYRIASVSRALGVSVRDFLTLIRLTGQSGTTTFDLPDDSLIAATPQATRQWIETYDRLRGPGFRVDELNWLLLHDFAPSFAPPLTDAQIGIQLLELRGELRKLRPIPPADDEPTPGELEEIAAWLAQKLALVAPDGEEALRIVRGESTLPPDEQAAFIDANFAAFLRPETLAALTDGIDRLLYVYQQLLDYLSQNMAVQKLAAAAGLAVAAAQSLLTEHLATVADPDRPALDVFLAREFIFSEDDPTLPQNFPDAYAIMRCMAKLGFVMDRLGIADADVDFILTRGVDLGWYDLRSIPVEAVTDDSLDIEAWNRLLRAQKLNRDLFTPPFSLARLLANTQQEGADRADVLSLLADQTRWELESIDFLTGPGGYGFAFPGEFGDERWLDRLAAAFSLINKAGISGAQIWSWNVPEASAALARTIKNTVKARYTNEQWLAVATELSDGLRVRRRDALVDFLVAAHSGIRDADDLFERLLIDPGVQPCFMTSRIKQAISSVQLFVYRIFLGLEPDVRFDADSADQWIWRKNYRVWEAGRKVFLYPENFTEPELRSNKSPLFKELEDNLLQEDVTADSVERAYLRYLRGLDEVAHLEIVGLAVEEGIHTIHIIGRTRATPPVYYYRRYIDNAYFTPWEKVEINIEGEHVLPMIYNRRLWLLWLVFKKKERQKTSNLNKPSSSIRHYAINVSWTEYRDGKWSSPKTSSRAISTRVIKNGQEHDFFDFRYDAKKGRYYFWAEVKSSRLNVYPFYHNKGDPDSIAQPNQYFSFNNSNADPLVYYREDPGLKEQGYVGLHYLNEIPYRVPKSSYQNAMKFEYGYHVSVYSKLVTWENGKKIDFESEAPLLLNNAPKRFLITPPHQFLHYFSQAPFFYEDGFRTFFVIPQNVIDSGTPANTVFLSKDYGSLNTLKVVRAGYLPAQPPSAAPPPQLTLLTSTGSMAKAVFTADAAHLVIDRSLTAEEPQAEPEDEDDAVPEMITDVAAVPTAPAQPPLGPLDEAGTVDSTKKYRFLNFYHPYTDLFIKQVNRFGVKGLLSPGPTGAGGELHRQLTPGSTFAFSAYGPQPGAVKFPHPREEIDFSCSGSYSDYNWEVFFHIPMLIANRLSQNQRFEDAQKWYHFIFDPTETDAAGLDADEDHRRFWKIKPFFEFSQATSIEQIVTLINQGDPAYESQVARWEADPFNPHLLACLRVVTYMKMVVMKYLDNLIAWADNLFRQDTLETINQATQLYVLAAKILGRPPVETPGRQADARTFADLRANLDVLSNAVVALENQLQFFPQFKVQTLLPADQGAAGKNVYLGAGKIALATNTGPGLSAAINFNQTFSWTTPSDEPENPPVLYFCLPNNSKLLAYFDTLADRLFKIRNCMNIEGIVRSLDLFEPPIEPGLLVKAAAAGVDLSSALDMLNAPLPFYRFSLMLQKAVDLCNDVKGLGGSLLAAIEKKDAEALAVLRAGNQVDVLKSMVSIKTLNIEEARQTLAAFKTSRDVIQHRIDFYRSREFKNASEQNQEMNLDTANVFHLLSQGLDLAANIAHLIPQFKGGVQGVASPEITASFGGQNVGQALQVYSKLYSLIAAIHTHKATMAGIKAGHERRQEDWDFQAALGEKELQQLEQQILAAEIRIQIAEKDLDQQKSQIEQAKEEEAFLKEKYTNQELYGRMISLVSSVYFQSYQMAHDFARRAERCFQHELGVQNTNFIEFGYWDNLVKGLHAGDRLLKDLRRMESAYLEQNRREYEITQHFSLALLNPRALLQLRETGRCEFDIPELAFDIAYPGQYMRRIKAVSLTIPCVTGPYTNVSARLSLVRSRVRVSGTSQGNYAYTGLDDPNFRHDLGGVESVAASRAQNDSGLFELNLRDERYLPFERAGAISTWQLSLPDAFRTFDYDSISDVILHLSYTAREGGDALRLTVETHIATEINRWLDELGEAQGLQRLLSFRHEFPNELHRLLFPAEAESQATNLPISRKHFPYFLRGRQLTATQAMLFIKPREDQTLDTGTLALSLAGVQGSAFAPIVEVADLPAAQFDLNRVIETADAPPWELAVTQGSLDPDVVDNLYLLITYSVAA